MVARSWLVATGQLLAWQILEILWHIRVPTEPTEATPPRPVEQRYTSFPAANGWPRRRTDASVTPSPRVDFHSMGWSDWRVGAQAHDRRRWVDCAWSGDARAPVRSHGDTAARRPSPDCRRNGAQSGLLPVSGAV